MQNMFAQALDTLKAALKRILSNAAALDARASMLRDMYWGEEEALKRLLPLVAEPGDLALTASVLQDAIASCSTLSGLEAMASRVRDLRTRIAFLEEGILQEEEEARDRLQAVLESLS